jgi:UV DNA damage endonuclease
MKIGYCCINISLNINKPKKEHISVNRGMTKKTFDKKGLEYVSELAIKNIKDLSTILKWNVDNDIFLYRMSSEMFPCIGFYKLRDLPNFSKIEKLLFSIGEYSKSNKIRLSFHPSHFCILASEKDIVVKNAIDELDKHAEIMDIMGLDQSHYYPINVHINTTKPTHIEAAERFCKQFENLTQSCKKRLVVENDDGINQYSTKMLYDMVYKKIGIPITHDFHHHNFGPSDITADQAIKLACSTWGQITPLTHMSSPKTIEDPTKKQTAHADYIYEAVENYGLDFDVELECKMKDVALISYRKKYC